MQTIFSKIGLLSLVCALTCGNALAQEADFDLSSQRQEKQSVAHAPGRKLNHGDWLVSPIPHHAVFNPDTRLYLADGVRVKDKRKAFAGELGFLPAAGKGTTLSLTIDFGAKVSAKAGVKQTSGAYALHIGRKGIAITGYDERGAFYGLQTLKQLLASPVSAGRILPFADINDYPDMPLRGVIEAFYGTPWSHQVRLSLIDFYGKFKMNAYYYGPKDDPYHSSPNWRLPYPEKEAAQIHELIAACRRNRVDFVWAIHPGKDIKWNEEDYRNLVRKFNDMYDLGVRHFALFFDDISGEGTNPLKQTELLNRLTADFVKAKKDVSPLTICPTDYTRLWANPAADGPLAIYGKTLDPDIRVFWTGDYVCSDLTKGTCDFVNNLIRRPALYWWNFPVTDYARNYLLQGPAYGLDTTLTAADVCGLVSNPMEYGEASKLPLYGVADYTWNMARYNPIDNWERGLAELMPDAREAYRTFAIHSADTESGYRRDESWETETFTLDKWSDAKADKLSREFAEIETVPGKLEKGCRNALLWKELQPWVAEFGKLGTRGKRAIEIARIFRRGNDMPLFWQEYVKNVMSAADRSQFDAHKVGTMKLQPFYENLMDDMAHEFSRKVMGEMPKDYKGISSFANSGTVITKLMLDNDTTTYYTSAMAQNAGNWIGVDLRTVRPVTEVVIRQGRNSVDDVDYFDHATLECSADGRNWTTLIADLDKQYDIYWKGDTVKARYVRLKRLDSQRTNYASVRTFEVNPLRTDNLGFALTARDTPKALRLFDKNVTTGYVLTPGEQLTFGIPSGTKSYTILTGATCNPLVCRLYDAKRNLLSEQTLTAPYSTLTVGHTQAATVTVEGEGEIFEIIPNP